MYRPSRVDLYLKPVELPRGKKPTANYHPKKFAGGPGSELTPA